MFSSRQRKALRWYWKKRSLAREDAYYAQKISRTGLMVPDTDALAGEMKRRFPDILPKPKGSLSILAVYQHHNWENQSLLSTLQGFGSVRHYDWNTDFVPKPKRFSRAYRRAMNAHMLACIDRWQQQEPFDVCFMYVSGEHILPDTLRALRQHKFPLLNLGLNDRELFVGKSRGGVAQGARDICRWIDLWWTSTESAAAKFVVEGCPVIFLPEGANPAIHRPLPGEGFVHDVSFVGARYGIRPAVVDFLRDNEVDVKTWGYGWPAGPLSIEDMVRTYARSRINLGFGGVAEYGDTFCLKGRDFEVPMSGGLYLTQHHEELERFFAVGREIVTWRTPSDLLDTIKRLLNEPSLCGDIRRNALARSLAEHKWEARFEKVFRLLRVLR